MCILSLPHPQSRLSFPLSLSCGHPSLSLRGEDALRCKSNLSGMELCLHSEGRLIKCPVSLNHVARQARSFRTLGPNFLVYVNRINQMVSM